MSTTLEYYRLLNALDHLEAVIGKGEDDHYYGAWYGGSAASGGHPARASSWPAPDTSSAGIEDATGAWSGTHFADVREYMRTGHIREGQDLANDPIHGISEERVAQATSTLTAAVANGESTPDLYRGLSVDAATASRFAALGPGDPLDMPLTSWSASEERTGLFSGGATGQGGHAVTLHLGGGGTGFDMSGHSFYPDEREWITDGRFVVSRATSGPNGVTVHLMQIGVFASPSEMEGLP